MSDQASCELKAALQCTMRRFAGGNLLCSRAVCLQLVLPAGSLSMIAEDVLQNRIALCHNNNNQPQITPHSPTCAWGM